MAFEKADDHGYYQSTVKAYQERMKTLNKVWDELGLPVRPFVVQGVDCSIRFLRADIS